MQSKKSMLFKDGNPWTKKGEDNFDIAMGAFDGAECCELTGFLTLKRSGKTRYWSWTLLWWWPPKETENIKKKICKIFKDNGLKITIEANSKSVDFLDVNFNLTNNTFSPYLKPNNKPLYVNMQNNHPLNMIKNIPLAINKRLSEISANKEIFQKAAPIYQEALDSSGYKHQLKFEPPQEAKTKNASRKRRVIWFNPPFSQNEATNIGKKFLRIIDENFPPSNPLHNIF